MYFRRLMKYKKFKAAAIFDGYKLLKNSVLIVDEGGIVEDLVAIDNAGDDIESFEGIITPGLINCHCHLELSHMKGLIPEKTGLVDFVFKIVTERHHSNQEILEAIEKAENEMLENGIVAVGDICNNGLTLHQKQKARLQYYNFIEASGWLPSISQTRFERAKEIYDQYKTQLTNSVSTIVPHAPYSVSENLWYQIQPFFENKVVSIHNQETAFEDEFFLEGTGDFKRMYQLMNIDNSHHRPTKKTSLQSYFSKLKNAARKILVHNTFTSQQDIAYVMQEMSDSSGTFFCLCVNANQYIENTLPPVDLLRKNNCPIVLGTDSLASNHSLNILDEIKTVKKNFPHIALEELLQWATINGAKALQMDGDLGSFEKGKKPGIILVNEEKLTAKRIL